MSTKKPSPHPHAGGVCPIVGKSHEFCPPQENDSRSPCPALNTLANHGYIPRNGKNLSVWDIASGLQAGYNLSAPLAWFLTLGGFLLLRHWGRISLFEIGRHGRVEHNASLVHHDTPAGHEYAPIDIDPTLVAELTTDVRSTQKFIEGPKGGQHRMLMDATDVARARIRRERLSPPLDPVHAEIARGEMAIVLGIMNIKGDAGDGVPIEWFREWIHHERMPQGWKPDHVQGLVATVRKSKQVRDAMKRMKSEEAAASARAGSATPPLSTNHSMSSSFSSDTTQSIPSLSGTSTPRTAVGEEDEKF